MSARKLWKVHHMSGRQDRPESKVKAYGIYVENARREYLSAFRRNMVGQSGGPGRFVELWVDERNGHGWQLHERIDLAEGAA